MELWHDRILVLDFGSQYTQLIARRIREAQVYSQILPCTVPLATILAYRPQGIVLSGGPSSVYEKKAPAVPKEPQANPPTRDAGWAGAPTSQVVRTVAAALLTTVVELGALFLLWQVKTFVGWFVIALILAAVLNPAVN